MEIIERKILISNCCLCHLKHHYTGHEFYSIQDMRRRITLTRTGKGAHLVPCDRFISPACGNSRGPAEKVLPDWKNRALRFCGIVAGARFITVRDVQPCNSPWQPWIPSFERSSRRVLRTPMVSLT
jgi:hypothetical protein